MEEQLQQSVMISEDGAYESSPSGQGTTNAPSLNGEEEMSDRDASGEEIEEGQSRERYYRQRQCYEVGS